MNTTASAVQPPDDSVAAAPRVARAAGIMIAAIFLSRILGLVRDMVMSYYFGAQVSPVADAYRAAFSLPDLFYYLIAGGALSSAFIPVFTEYLEKGDEKTAWKVFSVFGTAIALGLTVLILLGEILAPWLLWLFLPGFRSDPAKLDLTTNLTRIVFPAQICFFIGGLMMSTLYARNRFLMPALGPVVYNAAIILGAVVGGQLLGPMNGIYAQAWTVLLGALLGNIVMQLWEMRRVGIHYTPSLDLRHPGVIKVGKLMLPVLLGLSLPQLCVLLARPFASQLDQGAITWLDSANKVMQLPLGIFAQALSVAIFPTLSALAARQDIPGFRRQFSLGFRSILFLTIPSAVLILVLAVPLTALLFQRGQWTWDDTVRTSQATVFYSLAIAAVSGQQIVNRGFYAMQNTITPMVVGTAATVFYLLLNWLLMAVLGVNGLALSYTIANGATLAALLVLFHRHIGGLPLMEMGDSVGRVAVAATGMGIVVWLVRRAMDSLLGAYGPDGMHSLPVLFELFVCTGVGCVVYLTAVKLLRVPEAEFVLDTVGTRLRKLAGRGPVTAAAAVDADPIRTPQASSGSPTDSPARSRHHNTVREAIHRDGWTITQDPFPLSPRHRREADDADVAPTLIAAERNGRRIAIEIATLQGASPTADLREAAGRFVVTRALLQAADPNRQLYLAVSRRVYDRVFTGAPGEQVAAGLPLPLLVFQELPPEVRRWIDRQSPPV